MLLQASIELKKNQLICFPTETVYALAGRALSINCLEKIYRIKNRPYNKPLSIMVYSVEEIEKFSNLDTCKKKIIKSLSPGPVTFILSLNKINELPKFFFNTTVGVRIPDHHIALSLLRLLKEPLVATSVNVSGNKSSAKIAEIPNLIRNNVALIIEEDTFVTGYESDIIDLTGLKPRILKKRSLNSQNLISVLEKF